MKKQIKRLIIWECTIKWMNKDNHKKQEVLDDVLKFIKSEDLFLEV